MRALTLGLTLTILAANATAQKNIREVDFKNLSYPVNGRLLGHDHLQWLPLPSKENPPRLTVHLRGGRDLKKASSFVMDGKEYAQWEGFTLQSVDFADLTGEGREDAIVALRYQTGGTQSTNYVYIYSMENGALELLAYCYTGDRAHSGLYGVYGRNGILTFELFDPKKAQGDCCSSGILRTRYRWHADQFVLVGKPEPDKLPQR